MAVVTCIQPTVSCTLKNSSILYLFSSTKSQPVANSIYFCLYVYHVAATSTANWWSIKSSELRTCSNSLHIEFPRQGTNLHALYVQREHSTNQTKSNTCILNVKPWTFPTQLPEEANPQPDCDRTVLRYEELYHPQDSVRKTKQRLCHSNNKVWTQKVKH